MRKDILRVIRMADDLLTAARDPKIGIVGVNETANPVRARIDGYWNSGNVDAALEAAWHYFTIAQSFDAGMAMKRHLRAGRKVVSPFDEANAARMKGSSESRDDWQQRANVVWERNPKLSALQVAKMIARHDENPDTIRRKLARPGAVTT